MTHEPARLGPQPPSGLATDDLAEEQLAELLDQYLQHLERGQVMDVTHLCHTMGWPAARVSEYLQSIEWLATLSPLPAEIRTERLAASGVPERIPAIPHRQLGDYRLLREIGRGGMGVVYEAVQQSLERRVAIKVLPFAALCDERQIQRFRNEAKAAATLNHPHVVPVYSVGCEQGIYYYSMQWIDGRSLAELLVEWQQSPLMQSPAEPSAKTSHDNADVQGPSNTPSRASALSRPATHTTLRGGETTADGSSSAEFPSAGGRRSFHKRAHFDRCAQWIACVAEALDYAHGCGVVHRDIKPSNLLIDRCGKVWITDFGLARLDADGSLTRPGELLGTLRYMSPEQAQGNSAGVDGRTDIYALGSTLYELLTLTPLFAGSDRQEVLTRILYEEAPSPRRIHAAIPQDLETIVLKALAKDPADRYATGQAFADDLHRYLRGQSIHARRTTRWDRITRWTARHARWVSLSILLLASLSTTLLLLVFGLVSTNRRLAHAQLQTVHHWQVAHQAVDHFGNLLGDPWSGLHTTPALRAAWLAQIATYYQSLAASHPTEADGDVVRAGLHQRLGHTYFQWATTHRELHELTEAIARYQQARDSFLLHAQYTDDPRAWADVALCDNNLGEAFSARHDLQQAEKAYARAWEIYAALPRPANHLAPWRFDAFLTWTNLVRLRDKAAPASPAATDRGLGDLLAQLEDPEQLSASEALRGVELASQLRWLASQPKQSFRSQDQLHQLAWGYLASAARVRAADARLEQERSRLALDRAALRIEHGWLDEGLPFIDSAIETLTAQLDQTSEDPQLSADLAHAWNQRGRVLLACQSVSAASQAFANATRLLPQLATALSKSQRAGILHNQAIALALEGQHELAVDLLRRAMELQSEALLQAPDNPTFRQLRDSHARQLAYWLGSARSAEPPAKATVQQEETR